MVGQLIGRYRILELLGEGGMAAVYKALDTTLGRDVAIKFIRHEKLTSSAAKKVLARFEREARALAQLSHPNIVKVLDYGEHDGAPYLVMGHLAGGTLKQKLGQLMPWAEATQLLMPVAQALEYAHNQKIVHRDVKPANMLLSASGQPMLSDFGIAKILQEEETTELTGTGIGLGTPEYMAPEQALGHVVDRRADIYALGVVLYELVTGQKPFRADTPMAVAIKHVRDPLPRPRSIVPNLPKAVEQMLFKALAKNPADRYQSMAEFVGALESLAQERRRPALPLWAWATGGLMTLITLAAVGLFALFIPGQILPLPTSNLSSTQVSTNSAIAFVLTRTPTLTSTIAPTQTPTNSLTPTRRPTFTLTPTATPLGGGTGKIAFSNVIGRATNGNAISNIFTINADGSELTNLTNSQFLDDAPAWSPDGKLIAFHSIGQNESRLMVMNSDGSGQNSIADNMSDITIQARWTFDGKSIIYTCGQICIVAPDGSGLAKITNSFDHSFDLSPDSKQIVFFRNDARQLFLAETDGTNPEGKQLLNGFQPGSYATWSPDGQLILFVIFTSGLPDIKSYIYATKPDGSVVTQLTTETGFGPIFSPDGKRIAFTSNREGDLSVYVMNADGSEQTRLARGIAAGWSPDGKMLVYIVVEENRDFIHVMKVNGTGQTRLAEGRSPSWQP